MIGVGDKRPVEGSVVADEDQYMEVDSNKDAQITFRTDGETYVMLMYGRITPNQALSGGRMSVEGDERLVTAFSERFSGG